MTQTVTTPDAASPKRPGLHPLASRHSEETKTRSHPSGSRSTASTTETHLLNKILKTIMNK